MTYPRGENSNLASEFIRGLWQEKSEEERGFDMYWESQEKSAENLAIDIYLEMEEAVSKHEELLPYLDDLKISILRYNRTIIELSVAQSNQKNKDTKEAADRARRNAHNALMANLSYLSRAYVKKVKGPNHWRLRIDEGRGNRDRIKDWACGCANFIAKQEVYNEKKTTKKGGRKK